MKQLKTLEEVIRSHLEFEHNLGLRQGACGIAGTVLEKLNTISSTDSKQDILKKIDEVKRLCNIAVGNKK